MAGKSTTSAYVPSGVLLRRAVAAESGVDAAADRVQSVAMRALLESGTIDALGIRVHGMGPWSLAAALATVPVAVDEKGRLLLDADGRATYDPSPRGKRFPCKRVGVVCPSNVKLTDAHTPLEHAAQRSARAWKQACNRAALDYMERRGLSKDRMGADDPIPTPPAPEAPVTPPTPPVTPPAPESPTVTNEQDPTEEQEQTPATVTNEPPVVDGPAVPTLTPALRKAAYATADETDVARMVGRLILAVREGNARPDPDLARVMREYVSMAGVPTDDPTDAPTEERKAPARKPRARKAPAAK